MKLSLEAQKNLERFLKGRETDIALGMENFGTLKIVFREVFDRKPESEI